MIKRRNRPFDCALHPNPAIGLIERDHKIAQNLTPEQLRSRNLLNHGRLNAQSGDHRITVKARDRAPLDAVKAYG